MASAAWAIAEVDLTVGAGGRVVADPAEAGVGQARGPSTPPGQFPGGVFGDGRLELGGVDRDDFGQIVDVVIFEVLVHVEAVAERSGEHAAAGGRADDGEFLERQVDRPGRHPLAEDDVDAEVLHHRVDELLDRLGQAVDLVDEEDRALRRVRQIGHHVHLLVERGSTRHVQLDAQLVVQDAGEGRLAQAGRAIEEDVRQRLAALLSRPRG